MKVAVIGGGSSYTPELLDGLLERADASSTSASAMPAPDDILKTHRLALK
jgi:alpha-galactosidase/6-phospho-beta-glucosidase family protein